MSSVPYVFLTPAAPTYAAAESVRDRLARYFGEAVWTDPAAFAGALHLVTSCPEALEDEHFMRSLATGGWRRW